MRFDIKKRWNSYIEPYEPLSYAISLLSQTIKLFAPTRARERDQAFAKWYKTLGHHFSAFEDTTSVPSLVASCHGTVLELGPATGNQLPRFNAANITHIYGIEPNSAFMGALRDKIEKIDLEDMYTPILCRIEDTDVLETHGIMEGTVDCILSIQVLCSVEDPKKAAEVMYRLLKPGGELIFWEHHSSSDPLTWIVQRLWNPVWSALIGGCHLNRSIKDILLQSGSWEVEINGDEEPWSLLPRVWGRLRKVKDD